MRLCAILIISGIIIAITAGLIAALWPGPVINNSPAAVAEIKRFHSMVDDEIAAGNGVRLEEK